MRLSLKNMTRLAHLTRRWDPYRTPLAYRFGQRLLGILCSRKGKEKPSGRVVMPYDKGLINVDLSTKMGYKIMFHGYHDAEMARLIRHVTPPGATCIDVGANIGAYTLVMAFATGPTGRVIAVEPNPEVASELRANLALNRLDNVAVVEAALTNKDGEAALYTCGEDAPNTMVSSLKSSHLTQREVRVKTLTGRTLQDAHNITRCDLIKVDVLGGEMAMLEELSPLIEQCRPSLFVEHRRPTWEGFGRRIEEAVEFTRALNYESYVVKEGLTRPLEDKAPDICNLFCVPAKERAHIPGLADKDKGPAATT